LDTDGLTASVRGLSKRKPPNSLSYTDTIKQFIVHYANGNALPLPGRLPNVKKSIVLLLPTDKSMANIYQIYLQSAAEMSYRCISSWTFQRYWVELCLGQQFVPKLYFGGWLTLEEKTSTLQSYELHLKLVDKQT